MPRTGLPTGATHADTAMAAWKGREGPGVPPGWIDHAIARLFVQWNARLIKFEDTRNPERTPDTPEQWERDMRTIDQFARVLERLIKLETARAARRRTRPKSDREKAAASFDRRMVALVAAFETRDVAVAPDD